MTVSVPLLDLQQQFLSIQAEVRAAIERVLASQHFILGPEVAALEQEIAQLVGCSHAIGVSSGTDALLCALMAIGLAPGDEVIVPTFTFFATAGCVSRLGARPVFADIEPSTFNMDVAQLPELITSRTRAIIPVHLFGQCADMDPILDVAAQNALIVIEDAAQALGAKYKGRYAGSLGHLGCYSFFPSKNLGACGDGGMIVTQDERLAERCRLLRTHGAKPKYFHSLVGGNFRLDALQAAILRVKLRYLSDWTAGRRRNARSYDELLTDARVVRPAVAPYNEMVYNQYVIRHAARDALRAHLGRSGISTEIYYPMPLHLQECFASLGGRTGDLPVAEETARQVLALPIYPELTAEQQCDVAQCIRDFG